MTQGQAQALPVLNPVTDYQKIKRVGEGTYGVVCKDLGSKGDNTSKSCMPKLTNLFAVDKARHRQTGEIVALKKLRMDKERDGAHRLLLVRCQTMIRRNSNHSLLTHVLELHRHASHFSP